MTLHGLLDVVRDDALLHILFDTTDICGFVFRAPEARQLRIDGEVRRIWDEHQNIVILLIGSTLRPLAPLKNLNRIEKSMVTMFGR